jgi:dolichol-phosphate mannosyltransferase
MPIEVQSMQEWEDSGTPGMLSVIIPAHNEEFHIADTIRELAVELRRAAILFEILVVNDNSSDGTEKVLQLMGEEIPELRYVNNEAPHGYGWAVRKGFSEFAGDALVIVMADASDAPEDVVRFYRKLQEGFDCVFGTRFSRGGSHHGYPVPKLILNRAVNMLIQALFLTSFDDITNAFKMYRRTVIAGLFPLLAQHFNLTVELPLKALVRGYKCGLSPNTWRNRKTGESKFRIKEMGSRYLFIILYCLLEKWLLRQDVIALGRLNKERLQVWPK